MNLYKKNRGFTLIEMLVVIAIFGIFALITLSDYRKFGEKEKFIDFMYDTALSIRQTQINGIAVKEAGEGSENFQNGYGLHFSPKATAGTSYDLFVDGPDQLNIHNKYYDLSNLNNTSGISYDTVYTTTTFDPKYKIKQVCVFGSTNNCAAISDSTANSVDIVFNRPNPDAYITYNGANNNYISAEITVEYTNGSDIVDKKIVINTTGQVSIQ